MSSPALFHLDSKTVEAGGLAGRTGPFETILVSILLEQEKVLGELRSKIRDYKVGGREVEVPFDGRE